MFARWPGVVRGAADAKAQWWEEGCPFRVSCVGQGYNENWAREPGKSQVEEGCERHGKELEFILRSHKEGI